MPPPRLKVGDQVKSVLNPEVSYMVEKVDTKRRMTTVRVANPLNADLVFTCRTSVFVKAG